ncbi:MAG: tetratricopeptide repeat protein [Candidatus Aminicenantales bacterium]
MLIEDYPHLSSSAVRRSIHLLVAFSTLVFFLFLPPAPLSSSQEHMGKGRISGTVVDDKGQPLEGVMIVVESLKYTTKLQGKTDKKGHFAVAGMGTGMWRVTASKKGYAGSSVDVYVKQLTRNPPISFTLKKMTGFAALMSDEESFELFDKGNALLEEEKFDEALAAFEEFMEKYPEVFQVHLNIGSCYLKKGDLERAEKEFNFVLEKTKEVLGDYKNDPQTSLRAFTGLGEIYLQRQDYDRAMNYFAQSLEISPQDEVAAYNVAQVLFFNQKIDEAIEYYKLAIKIKPDWSKPYLRLGYAYLNKGDFEKALENFKKFIDMDPENPEVPRVKGIIDYLEKIKK